MWSQAEEWRAAGLTFGQICGRLSQQMGRFGLQDVPSEDTVRRQLQRRKDSVSQHLGDNLKQSELQSRLGNEEEGSLRVDFGTLIHSKRPGVNYDYSSAWMLDITLTNSSRSLPIGIKSFVLEVSRFDEGHIMNHIGKDKYGSNQHVPLSDSDLDESLRIEPVTTVRGNLRFLDRFPFSLNAGAVTLVLIVEESGGQCHTYELGEMNIGFAV